MTWNERVLSAERLDVDLVGPIDVAQVEGFGGLEADSREAGFAQGSIHARRRLS